MASKKRLIDANALAITYCEVDEKHNSEPWILSDVLGFLNDAPTVDAVEVVRCIECQHYHQYCVGKDKLPTGWGKCTLINMDIDMTIRDYCSHGERKDDGK